MSVTDTKPETAKTKPTAGGDAAVAVQTKPPTPTTTDNKGALPTGAPQPSVPVKVKAEAQQAGAAAQEGATPNLDQKAQQAAPSNLDQKAQQAGTMAPLVGIKEKIQQTREQIKKDRVQQGNAEAETEADQQGEQQQQSLKRTRIRLIPIWLRIVIIFLLLVFSLVAGTMVGYGVIGGGNPWEVLKQSTWTHIVDLINKE